MPLNPQRPGLWVNDAWRPGGPGTFAVVIGSSRYQYLDGTNKLRLGQLCVSATTAYSFLKWSMTEYRRTGSPLAKLWLLLSPTAVELSNDPALARNTIDPTFENCSFAIQEWFGEMSQLSNQAAEQSRSVFFFSGHGLEVYEDQQVLLPSDYLRPGTPNDRALSTRNISRGLKALRVPIHFLFLDACRNDHESLNKFTPLEGTRILNEPSNEEINPDCFVPIFYGSAAGEQAFSPKSGESLLGQALLEGLRANGLKPECKSGTCWIDLHILRPFVQGRIAEIVRTKYKGSVVQRVRVRGDQTEDPVTEVVPPQPQAGGVLPPRPPPLSEFSAVTLSVRSAIDTLRPTAVDEPTGHQFFGSERVTSIWREKARVYDFDNEAWLPRGSDFEVSGIRRAPDASSLAFDLMIPSARPGKSYWLQLEDERQAFACALPLASVPRLPDQRPTATRFRIEMDLSHRNHEIDRLEVGISTENHSEFFLDSAAKMWNLYDQASSRDAELEYDFLIPHDANALQDLVRHKHYSPFAAVIAGSILIRARRWDKLKDWLRNLANIEPYGSDAQVLWVEQCLRQPRSQSSPDEVLGYFRRLALLPLPFLSETLGYSLRQAEELEGGDFPGEPSPVIEEMRTRLRRGVGVFRAGGLFATFAGPKDYIAPSLVLPSLSEVDLMLAGGVTEADINEIIRSSTPAAADSLAEEAEEEDDAEAGV